MASLESIVNIKYLNALASYGLSNNISSSSSSTNSAIKSKSQEPAVSVALRTGALTFATAIAGLNTTATFINIAKDNLQKLDVLADKIIEIADKAKRAGTGTQTRKQLDFEFHRLGNQFKQMEESATVEGINYLTTSGLAQILASFGLDPNSSNTVAEVFTKFEVTDEDTFLASENETGKRPIPIPEDAFHVPTELSKKTVEYRSLFDENRKITNRPDGYRLAYDLKALKEQISLNLKALDAATDLVADNLKLARGAGQAFLDLATTTTDFSNARKIARDLTIKIRQNASGALAQAENLQAITVAALVRNQNSGG